MPRQRSTPNHSQYPPMPSPEPPPLRHTPHPDQVKAARAVLERPLEPRPATPTLDTVTIEMLENCDEDDFKGLMTILQWTLETATRQRPRDVPRLLALALWGKASTDELPGWVYGVAASITAMQEASLQILIQRSLLQSLRQVIPQPHGRPPRIAIDEESLSGVVTEMLGGDHDAGEIFFSLLRERLSRRRRIALGLPFDKDAYNLNSDKLESLQEILERGFQALQDARADGETEQQERRWQEQEAKADEER